MPFASDGFRPTTGLAPPPVPGCCSNILTRDAVAGIEVASVSSCMSPTLSGLFISSLTKFGGRLFPFTPAAGLPPVYEGVIVILGD